MKRKTRLNKFGLLLALLALMAVTLPVLAEEGDVTGSFGTNGAPEVTSILIHNTGTTDEPASLTPLETYDIKVTVSEPDGLGNLDSLDVKLFADTTGLGLDQYTETNFDNAAPDRQSAAMVRWDRETNSCTVYFEDSTSWALGTATLPAPADIDGTDDPTSFTFVFPLTIGKAAFETNNDYYEWYLGAKVTDGASISAYNYFNGTTAYKTMNWYGEVAVPEGITVDWGDLPPGTPYSHADAMEKLDRLLLYNSNGLFAMTAKADTTWTGSPDGSVTLTETVFPTELDNFYIRACFVTDADAEYARALDADGQPVEISYIMNPIGENGYAAINHTLWMSTSENMTGQRVYTGTIYYGVVND